MISITDGQIYLESALFNNGIRPAVNVGISVSRVGGNAQIKCMKKVAGTLKIAQAQFRELESFTKFGGDIDPVTARTIDTGRNGDRSLCPESARYDRYGNDRFATGGATDLGAYVWVPGTDEEEQP